jgi:serine/threonine protein kinase
MSKVIGEGSYGQVSIRNGFAVKKFTKLQHIIQEYIALQYLRDCDYVVKATEVNFEALELSMELYNCSLRVWLNANKLNEEKRNICIHDILTGLIELHDRDIAHGDIKPGNILVNLNPFRLVIADCGFASISKYAKVERTAAPYRDPYILHHTTHDMYSFGICLYELSTGVRVGKQLLYEKLLPLVEKNVKNTKHKHIICNLVNPEKELRYNARETLAYLTGKKIPAYKKKKLVEPKKEHAGLRNVMKYTSYHYNINRSLKGYQALLHYIERHTIHEESYQLYTGVTLIILSSLFGSSEFKEKDIFTLCNHKYTNNAIIKVVTEMLSDSLFIDHLFDIISTP